MAVDIFLKIEGIDGESTDDAHDKWIELESCSHGISQPVTGASGTGGRTGGRADFQDLVITKSVDAATPDLCIACCSGKHIPKIEVEFCLATEDKHKFLKYELENVIVSSISSSGGGGEYGSKPQETVSFAFGKIKWEYTPIDDTGSPGAAVDRTWSLELNKQE